MENYKYILLIFAMFICGCVSGTSNTAVNKDEVVRYPLNGQLILPYRYNAPSKNLKNNIPSELAYFSLAEVTLNNQTVSADSEGRFEYGQYTYFEEGFYTGTAKKGSFSLKFPVRLYRNSQVFIKYIYWNEKAISILNEGIIDYSDKSKIKVTANLKTVDMKNFTNNGFVFSISDLKTIAEKTADLPISSNAITISEQLAKIMIDVEITAQINSAEVKGLDMNTNNPLKNMKILSKTIKGEDITLYIDDNTTSLYSNTSYNFTIKFKDNYSFIDREVTNNYNYFWQVDSGTLNTNSSSVCKWTSPATAGKYRVYAYAYSNNGWFSGDSIEINIIEKGLKNGTSVKLPTSHYGFSFVEGTVVNWASATPTENSENMDKADIAFNPSGNNLYLYSPKTNKSVIGIKEMGEGLFDYVLLAPDNGYEQNFNTLVESGKLYCFYNFINQTYSKIFVKLCNPTDGLSFDWVSQSDGTTNLDIKDSHSLTLKQGSVVILYANTTFSQGFDFSKGIKQAYNVTSYVYEPVDAQYDILFTEVGFEFRDKEGNNLYTIDMGVTAGISEVPVAPFFEISESQYKMLNKVEIGHTYIVRTADTKFAKFRVTSMNTGTYPYSLQFDWMFQDDGSRLFSNR